MYDYNRFAPPRDPVDAFIASLEPSSRELALDIQRRYKRLTSDFTRALLETNDAELARYCTAVSSQIHVALIEWRALVRMATEHAERTPGPAIVVVEVPREAGGEGGS